MNKSRVLKLIALALVLALASGALFLLSSCEREKQNILEIVDYEKPEHLEDYQLELKWYNERGEETTFNRNRPVVIMFGGYSVFDARENLVLPEEAYNANTAGVIYNRALRFGLINANYRRSMSAYWRNVLGFNVGVFHYEAFADDTADNLAKKVFDKDAMTYTNVHGAKQTENLPDFNLTDAFVMAWLKLMTENPLRGTIIPNRAMEVRFIGDGAGALLAINSANTLMEMYRTYTNVDGGFVPNRIALTSPDFSSYLSLASQTVENLGNAGCVFELIENKEIAFENEAQQKQYDAIKSMSAYLFLRETFSDKYPEEYAVYNRAVRDWYLYSAGGSDDTTASSPQSTINGWQDSYPMRDDRTNKTTTLPYYSVSAWTPTIYVRALRGVEFNMVRYAWDTATSQQQPSERTIDMFSSETLQISNLKGVIVCGYVYESLDETVFVNHSYSARLANVTVRVSITLTGNSTRDFDVLTGADGFYSFVMRVGEYSNSHRITVIPPNRGLRIGPTATSETSPNEHTRLFVSRIGTSGENVTAFIQDTPDSADAPRNRFQIIIRNCGLVR
jgi:hypothetical protein